MKTLRNITKNAREGLIALALVGSLGLTVLNVDSGCSTVGALNQGYSVKDIESCEMEIGLGESSMVYGSLAKLVTSPGRYFVEGLDEIGLVSHGIKNKTEKITSGDGFGFY